MLNLVPWWLKLIAVAVIAGALIYGWHVFTESYREQGRAEIRPQLVASQAAERQREAETAQCVAASVVQSDAIVAAAKRATDVQAASAKLIAERQAENAKRAPRIAELQARAAAAPKLQACEKTLADADAIARESARARRK